MQICRTWIVAAALAALPSLCGAQSMSSPLAAPEELRAEGPPITWSLEAFEQLALERNPTLVQASAQAGISQGKALQAGLYPNPMLGYVAEQIGADGTVGELHGMFVEQQIVTGGKLQLSRAKFAQEASQAELQVLAQRYRVLHSVRVAFYEALVRQRRIELRRQLLDNSQQALQTVEELVNVGQANQADALQAQIQWRRAGASLQVAQRRFHGSWQQLTAVSGLPEMPPAALSGNSDAEPMPLDRGAALAQLLTESPQLRFARAEVLRDQIALRRERVEPIPNVNLRAETGYNFESRDTVAGLEIGIRVPLFDRNQGTIQQAQAELARAQADVHRMELLLRKQFADAFAEYEAALTMARLYRAEAIPQAAEVYQLYVESFRQRRAAWPQVLDAQREYFELYEEYLDHVLDARRAEAGISSMFLEDGLQPPPGPTPEGHRDATPKPR